ncbi:MAG: hypothetical protein J6Y20_07330 [Lachnospiraceae bacterium]|nr:hypothetical protein [Lachnospiraceae bacterium]
MSYEKLEPFEKKQTNWLGLWWHPEYCGYSSAAIDLSQLRKFKGKVRLLMRKNKFLNGGENGRPNYTFCLKDCDSPTFEAVDVEDDDGIMAKVERLREVMQAGQRNADVCMLPSESAENARSLMAEAISIVEEITGEKWEFSFMTFGA